MALTPFAGAPRPTRPEGTAASADALQQHQNWLAVRGKIENELAVPCKIEREREIRSESIRLQRLAKSVGRLGGGGRAGRLRAVRSESAERRPPPKAHSSGGWALLCAVCLEALLCSQTRPLCGAGDNATCHSPESALDLAAAPD